MGTRQARPMRSRRSRWTGSAALRTRSRKDWPFEEEEEVDDEETPSGRSEREETQPAAPGDLLRLQEDTELNTAENRPEFSSVCKFC